MKVLKSFFILFISASIVACSSNSADSKSNETLENSAIFNEEEQQSSTPTNTADDVHKVKIVDILPADKYVYLSVEEAGKTYWIATLKQDAINIGDTYYYSGGHLQKDFKSKEYDRVFEEIYLVSSIVPAGHSQAGAEVTSTEEVAPADVVVENRTDGTVSIAELTTNSKAYDGQKVTIKGECTKVNENIMGTNWVHVKDGSNDSYDFIATTSSSIAVGESVILEGVLALDKDFGAGYKYSVILENCTPVKQ